MGLVGEASQATSLPQKSKKQLPTPPHTHIYTGSHCLPCACRSSDTRPSSGICRLCSESSPHSLRQQEEKARPRERRPLRQRLSGASRCFSVSEREEPLCGQAEWHPTGWGVTPSTEILPVPQTACCQLSELHRNWSVFYKLTDVIAWRNVGESQNELQGFLVPIPPW